MNAPQGTPAIPHFSAFQPGEKAAAVVSPVHHRFPVWRLRCITLYIVRIRLRNSLHSRPLLCPSLRRRGSILRHLQTNVVPESFARSLLLPLPTRAICRLLSAQQLDQGRERMDRHQVDP